MGLRFSPDAAVEKWPLRGSPATSGLRSQGEHGFGEVQATLVGQARSLKLKRRFSCRADVARSISVEAAGRNDCLEFSEVEIADRVQRLGGGAVL